MRFPLQLGFARHPDFQEIARGAEAAGDHRGDIGVGQVIDVGPAGVQAVDRGLPDVEAGDVQADAHGLLGQRQADIAKANDHHVHSKASSLG